MKHITNNKPLKAAVLLAHLFFATIFMLQAQELLPPEAPPPTIVVGAIPGEIDVSPMGAATYNIPIEVVPGTQGVQPNLSIVYNSFSGMGILGMKWNLAGLSAISRCGQIPYYDNNLEPIQFKLNDRFTLDGARLLQMCDGVYGGNEVQYATELETFTRVVSYGGGQTGFPEYFRAFTDDGTIMEYGNGNNSKQQLENNNSSTTLNWFVNKITDANGNYMSFYYDGYNGEIWIDEIRYTANPNSTFTQPYAKVKFNYSTTNLLIQNTCFTGGLAFPPQTQLLQYITVSYKDTVIRQYEFNYNTNVQNERTPHLTEIILKGAGNTQLKATTIEWGKNYSSIVQPQAITGLPSNFPAGKVLSGDFNGDGYTDFVVYNAKYLTSLKKWEVYLFDPLNEVYNIAVTYSYSSDLNLVFAQDIDGDGEDELIIGKKQKNTSSNDYEFTFYSIKNGSYSAKQYKVDNFHSLYFGDFDGDGVTDILFVKVTTKTDYLNYTTAYWELDIYSINNFGLINFKSDYSYTNSYADFQIVDIRGNGRNGIRVRYSVGAFDGRCKIYENNSSELVELIVEQDEPFSYHPDISFYGDVNGDGLKDILICRPCASTPHWELFISKGDKTYIQNNLGTALDPNWLGSQNCNKVNKIRFADLNGDGKEDIIQGVNWGENTTTFNILLSKGCIDGVYEYTKIAQTVQGKYAPLESWSIGDINGDGKLEIILRDTLNLSEPPKVIYINQDNDYEFVKEITDGIGKKIKLNYKHTYFTAKSRHQQEHYPYSVTSTAQKNFLPVIDFVQVSNGPGYDFNTLKYKFSTLIYSLPRRTLLGFNEVESINVRENIRDSMAFNFGRYYDHRLQILLPDVKVSFVDNIKTSITRYSVSVWDLDNFTRFIYKSDGTEYNYLTDVYSETKNTLNNQGRIIASSSETYNGASPNPAKRLILETKNYLYKGICFQEQLQRKTVPERIISTQQYGNGPTIADTTIYTYGELGRLASVEQTNSDGFRTTSYGNYLPSGICQLKTVTAIECPARSETYSYDATQRFTASIKNMLDHETKFYYDAKTGNKTKEIDPNGLTTKYDYDSFGNLTLITYPDGNQTTTSVKWYLASSLNAKYYISTQTPAKPSVTVYYDLLGREVCRLDDGYYYDTHYNAKGEVDRVSYPYKTLGAPDKIWRTYTYDEFGRKKTETAPYTNLSYTYSTDHKTITTTHNGITSSKEYDALGRMIKATDGGGTINYTYSVTPEKRHQTEITVQGSGTTAIITDQWGNRLSINDPNAGKITSTYNGFGELMTQTDANENVTSYQYDLLGRVTQKKFTAPNNTTQIIDYSYDKANKGKGKLYKIVVDDVEELFMYDNLSRLQVHKKQIDNTYYAQTHTYDNNGQLQTLTYSDGFSIKYSYLSNGKLDEIRKNDSGSKLIYRVSSRNKYNQPNKCEYGNEVVTEYEYNPYGLLTHIQTGKKIKIELPDEDPPSGEKGNLFEQETDKYTVDSTILNYRYAYDTEKGLMSSRSESVMDRLETFTYDVLDRLETVIAGAIGETGAAQRIIYANNGNILNNSAVGVYSYEANNRLPALPPKFHAVTKIEPINNSVISANQCDVTYNYFNQPTQITEGAYKLNLFYGANQQRNKVVRYINKSNNYVLDNTRIYFNKNYEKEIDATSGTRYYHYIYGDNGVVALHIAYPNTDSIYYIHTDHLGSYCALTNANKQVRQHNYFDPWGNSLTLYRGNALPPDPPQAQTSINFTLTHRGFTSHEHYPYFKIINMNGRLYDPVIGRFFSPDKYVANSSFTQDFNRYSYARNNPLMYSDPDGEHPLLIAALVGAISGALHGAIQGAIIAEQKGATGGEWAKYFFGGMGIGMGIGALSGMAGGALGGALNPVGIGGAAGGAIAGGVIGLPTGALNGLAMGALAGKKGSDLGAATGWGALMGFGTGVVMGGLMGGIQAKLDGKTFWNGATRSEVTFAQPMNGAGKQGTGECALYGLKAHSDSFGENYSLDELSNHMVWAKDCSKGANPELSLKNYADWTDKDYYTIEYPTRTDFCKAFQDDYRVGVNKYQWDDQGRRTFGHYVDPYIVNATQITRVNGTVVYRNVSGYLYNPYSGVQEPFKWVDIRSSRMFFLGE